MNKKLHVATSPLSNNIFAGTLLKCGTVWSSNKQDVTIEAIVAVADYVIGNKAPVIVRMNGLPKYEISVKIIDGTGD